MERYSDEEIAQLRRQKREANRIAREEVAKRASQRWTTSKNKLWFVVGENGSLWTSTASFTRRGAIETFEAESKRDWDKWYRDGFRCRRVELKYRFLT